jgi:uncharacterized membrane protein (DUF485 family)
MAEPRAEAGPPSVVGGPAHHADIDWERAAHSPEFQELERSRRSFVIPATIFFVCWYFGFIILAGYAPDFMGESIYEGFTVGYLIALSQFVMVWVLAGLYLRKANREFDPLAKRVAEVTPGAEAYIVGDGHPRAGDGRPRTGDGRPGTGDGPPPEGDGPPRAGDGRRGGEVAP